MFPPIWDFKGHGGPNPLFQARRQHTLSLSFQLIIHLIKTHDCLFWNLTLPSLAPSLHYELNSPWLRSKARRIFGLTAIVWRAPIWKHGWLRKTLSSKGRAQVHNPPPKFTNELKAYCVRSASSEVASKLIRHRDTYPKAKTSECLEKGSLSSSVSGDSWWMISGAKWHSQPFWIRSLFSLLEEKRAAN